MKTLFLIGTLLSGNLFANLVPARSFGETFVDGKNYKTITLRSDELHDDVVDNLFLLMGLNGHTINGADCELFPLSLLQGFNKPNPSKYPQSATLHFQNEEISVSKNELRVVGSTAHTLYNLLENNFFHLKSVVKTFEFLTQTLTYKNITCSAFRPDLDYICKLNLQSTGEDEVLDDENLE